MILYIAKKKKENQLTGEASYFFEETNLHSFLSLQKDYKGHVVEPFKKKRDWIPINWYPEKMGQDDSTDYIEEYRQFKSNVKVEYHDISLCLFLKFYSKILTQKEILKLLKIQKKGMRRVRN
ncbi:hypothetical protein [Carnobacterium maltaromaticum]|uniref:hypothetical protein n=1 Tax=Carnobacterium maltaromaticum TaxID=2751 RepID=UPI0012FB65A0|nr:hypothetical protein [Carnobacterium maltaromaticum]